MSALAGRRRGRAAQLALVLLAAIAACAPGVFAAPGEAASPAPTCPPGTPLTLVAFDSSAGRALLTYVGSSGPVWIDLSTAADRAELFAGAPQPPPFAGSIGPGPIFALRRLEAGVYQPVAWQDGTWTPLGDRMALADDATFHATWDRSGRAWLIEHRRAEPPWTAARAFRLEKDVWRSAGSAMITAVAPVGASPAPWSDRAVVSGTAVFEENGARQWLERLPALPGDGGGFAVPLNQTSAAYFAEAGELLSTRDGGRAWSASRWRPWGTPRRDVWTYGSDFLVDLPMGSPSDPLPVAWFDRRSGRGGRLLLTRWDAAGSWRLVGEVDPILRFAAAPGGGAEDDATGELIHLLRLESGAWLLASDCLSIDGSPAIALRSVSDAGTGPVRPVPLTAGP